MRRISGPTDRIVVVGAGLGGLSAALRLAGAGRHVTLLERSAVPGGRAGVLEIGGYTFDTGPTVLTLPHLVADCLACVDEDIGDWLELRRLDPAYRACFADGSRIDVHADVDAMTDEIRRECGPADAAGYQRFVTWTRELYDLELPHYIDRNLDSPFDLARVESLRLARLGGFRRLAPVVAEAFHDERLRRLFSFQSMYAGLAPDRALALYAVITYMDCVAGVFHPVGGMHAVPRALAGAAAKHGVDIRYGVEASRIEFAGDRAVAVRTADGDRIPCDAIVVNADLPTAWDTLLSDRSAPWRLRRPAGRLGALRYSPSCVVLHVGSRLHRADQAHHTIHFGEEWDRVFREVIDEGRPMSDPSLLVTCPSVTDPSVAPSGRSTFYVLAPTPNLDAGIDWDSTGPRYRDEIFRHLEALGYRNFGEAVEVQAMTTPADWARQGLARGTPFAVSHGLLQTGPFRPANVAFDNVVFAGSGTQPGVGVPMVLISGRLAAERIVGSVA
jgi:phytoene desaturase